MADIDSGVRNRDTGSVTDTGLPRIPLNHRIDDQRQLIGIRGLWYDITDFIPRHPGGQVIRQFVGKDATAVFSVMHMNDVLRHRRPVAYYDRQRDDEQAAFLRIHESMTDEGYFVTDAVWYTKKLLFTSTLLALCIYCIVRGTDFWTRLLGGVLLAAFWQQCSFFMHDAQHNQITHRARLDRVVGTFFGTVCTGINGSWWKAEHHVHHSLTNTVDYKTGFTDPQMKETLWAQNQLLFPFYRTKLEELLIKVQHITFLPVCIFVGRPAIIVDAMKSERNVWEWLAILLHFAWTALLLSYLPDWRELILVYFTASSLQGILHIQLLLNHYAKPFYKLDQVCNSQNWFRMQIEGNINIKCPQYLDWFHGGLNLHIEHHLFPNMPRHHFRRAQVLVRKLCDELNIEYEEIPLSSAILRTLKHLKTCGQLFSLDPR